MHNLSAVGLLKTVAHSFCGCARLIAGFRSIGGRHATNLRALRPGIEFDAAGARAIGERARTSDVAATYGAALREFLQGKPWCGLEDGLRSAELEIAATAAAAA